MKVCLIQAFSLEESNPLKVYPLGIVTLATHLRRRGHEVRLLDLNMEADAFGTLKRGLAEFRPDAVGISLRNIDPLANKTSSLVPMFKVTVRFIARVLPGTPIIAGGTGFSLFPERLMLELPEIKYGLTGESELSFPALLDNMEDTDIPGLTFRRGGTIVSRKTCRRFDFSRDYLVPDRALLDPSGYQSDMSYVPANGVETTRGCPYNCAYCVYPDLQGKDTRSRSPGDVADEIEMLCRDFGIRRIHLNDPVVNMHGGYLESICEEILRRGIDIKWGGFFREDTLTRENIGLFARSGCECFAFSPDGMSGHALDVLEKGITIDDVIKAAELASGQDILSIYHFMVNVPGETDVTVSESIALVSRLYDIHGKRKNLGTVIFNNMRIMPNTKLEKIARAEGIIDGGADLLYPAYYNPPPYGTLRYELEAFHSEKNIFGWQEV